ncbi:MAG: hypothetical protein C0448_09120 [Sphingobacteriaceae bacterium]|nr:hypothetical protein [Sphingobacteriaceae bacterium]
MKRFLIYLIIVVIGNINAQNSIIDYLKKIKNIDSAIIESQAKLKKAESTKNDILFIEIGTFLASKYNSKSKFKEAKQLIDKCLLKSTQNNFYKHRGYLIIQLADNYKLQLDNPNALKNYLYAHKIFLTLKDSTGILRTKIELAEYFRKIGDYTKASNWINKAFSFAKSFDRDSVLLIKLYGRAAAIKNETAKGDSAIILSLQIIKMAECLKDSLALAQTLNELGFTYKNKLKPDTSEILYKQAEEIYRKLGDDYNLIHVMNNRAMLYAHNNYPKKVIQKMYFEIIHEVNDKKLNFDLSNVYLNLSTREIIDNDSSKAFFYFKKYHDIYLNKITNNKDIEINKIIEEYNNENIKKDMISVEDKLKLSEQNLRQKQKQNDIVIVSLTILVLFLVIIITLLYRLNTINKELSKKNKEKDALIQEVHHRVKNNLQLINAILKMQLNSIPDENKKEYLKEASRRINAMSLVHEMLYNKDTSEYIVLKEYLIELTEKLKELVLDKTKPLIFDLHLGANAKFNTTYSVAIGMITSEIVSNAIKHGFHLTSEPKIAIFLKFSSDNKHIIYSIKDNGSGINKDNQKEGLGTRLIDIFARQVEADYKIINETGLEYEFKIPYVANDK